MSACSWDRNTGSSAGAALRIICNYLRYNRSVKRRMDVRRNRYV